MSYQGLVTDNSRRKVVAALRELDGSAKDKAEIKARMGRLSNKDLGAALVTALGLFVALARAGFRHRDRGRPVCLAGKPH